MKKTTLLLVDDDPEDIEIFRLALEKAGSPFALSSLRHGGEAVLYLSGEGAYADRNKFPLPDLLLLDLAMPVVNGFDVLRWMRRKPDDEVPPVIVLSYSHFDHDVRLAHQLGAKLYLTKSATLEGTVRLVRSLEHFWKRELARDFAHSPDAAAID